MELTAPVSLRASKPLFRWLSIQQPEDCCSLRSGSNKFSGQMVRYLRSTLRCSGLVRALKDSSRFGSQPFLQLSNNSTQVIDITHSDDANIKVVMWNDIATLRRDHYHRCQLLIRVQQW